MKQSSIVLRRPGARGFALIEALIAVVVLATGLLALTALQGALMRSSADSKARSQVAAYAASEMDRIRTGNAVAAKAATPAGTDDISLAARAAGLSTMSQTVSAATYYANASGNFATTNPDTGKNAWFRRVTLNLSWTDATGGSRSLSMTTDISPLALTASKVLVDREPSDDTGLRPIVRRPSPVSEGMIPIATGGEGDEATAATNPKPKLLGGESGTYVSDTRFDILTYSSGDGRTPDGFARFNKLIETAVVGCRCRNDTAGFDDKGPAGAVGKFLAKWAFRPAVWTGRSYQDPKPVATVTSSPATASQSQLCDVCCRDHKDPASEAGPRFSPWPGQTASHFRINETTGVFEAADAGEYIEACRIIRVNGVYRVTADPKILDNALVATIDSPPASSAGAATGMPSNNTSARKPIVSEPGRESYLAYAYDAVSSLYFDTSSVPAGGKSTDFRAIQAARKLDAPSYVPILEDDRRWLHGRVFMVDYLEADAAELLKKASNECKDTSSSEKKAFCLLPYLPMATINTTEISGWSPRDAIADDPRPTELAALDLSRLDYAQSQIRPHNSGLALFRAINPNEINPSVLPLVQDEQLFAQVGTPAGSTIPPLQTPSPNPTTARLFGNPGDDPMRGYAQTCGAKTFKLDWTYPAGNTPPSPVRDRNTSTDPSAFVGAGCACTPATGIATPYTCVVSKSNQFSITLVGYNRFRPEALSNPCSGGGTIDRPVLYCYAAPTTLAISPSSYSHSLPVIGGAGLRRSVTFEVSGPAGEALNSLGVTFGTATRYPSVGTCPAGTPVWTDPDPNALCP